jgi:short subunit dehydrogenase-like uncharacterized protein
MTPAERVAVYRDTLEKAEPMLAEAEKRTIQLQEAIDDGFAMFTDPNVPMDERKRIWQTVAKLRAMLPQAIEYETRIREWVERTRAAIEELEAAGPVDTAVEFDAIARGVGGLSTVLPPPFNALAPILAALLPAVGWIVERLKRRDVQKTARAVVDAIDHTDPDAAMKVKGTIAAEFERKQLSKTGKKIVQDLKAA